MKIEIKNLIRALRLPFAAVSVLGFVFGSLLAKPLFSGWTFLLGLVAVLGTHLAANLINDYADSRSGADWQDKKFYKFFGGSKLIQEKVLSERFYLKSGIVFAAVGAICVIALHLVLKNLSIIGWYLLIIFLGASYTAKPLALSYRRLGEPIIFLLFGPALIIGGFFIQTQVFPAVQIIILSLPFGFLTTAILYANEISDFLEDRKAGKHTWVGILGREKAFILYYLLEAAAFLSIIVAVFLGHLSRFSLYCLLLLPAVLKAGSILRSDFANKHKLIKSSQLTIAVHHLTSVILILDLLL